jgi:hypothetical protein
MKSGRSNNNDGCPVISAFPTGPRFEGRAGAGTVIDLCKQLHDVDEPDVR